MSLACFQCCGRNRKQAAAEPAPQTGPQAATEDINLGQFRTTPQRRSTDMEGPEIKVGDSSIDDTAIVPAKGFLAGDFVLPTYRPKNEVPYPFSPANWVLLTISDVLSTMRKESYLARSVLFETARLQRPLFSVGSVKLSQDARVIDMQLIELDKVLGQGDELIRGSPGGNQEIQDLLIKGEPFQKALRAAKKSLLELEKTFNDQILGELKNGMQSKESIDHEEIVGKVKNLNHELRQVYSKVTTTYREEWEKYRGIHRPLTDSKSPPVNA